MLEQISVKRIDHVTVIISDLDKTRAFYKDLLGMDEVSRPNFGFPGLWFQAGTTQIHATMESPEAGRAGWGDHQGATLESRGHHFAFEVDDAYACADLLRSKGIEILRGPQNRPDGPVQLYIADPDGHIIELYST